MESSAPQIERWLVSIQEDGAVAVETTWVVRTSAGRVEYNTLTAYADPSEANAYDTAKDAYDNVVTALEAAPYNLTVAAPPAGKARAGFPEAAE